MIKIITMMQEDKGLLEHDYLIWKNRDILTSYREYTQGNEIIYDENFFRKMGIILNNKINVYNKNNLDKYFDVYSFDKIDELVYNFYENKNKDLCVIGGSNIYKEFLPFTSELYFHIVNGNENCRETFPKINNTEWKITMNHENDEFIQKKYVRKRR